MPLMEREGSASVRVLLIYYPRSGDQYHGAKHKVTGSGMVGGRGQKAHLVHQRLDLGAERVLLALRRGGGGKVDVELLVGRFGDVAEEVCEVLGSLEVDLAVVGVHCLLSRRGECRAAKRGESGPKVW